MCMKYKNILVLFLSLKAPVLFSAELSHSVQQGAPKESSAVERKDDFEDFRQEPPAFRRDHSAPFQEDESDFFDGIEEVDENGVSVGNGLATMSIEDRERGRGSRSRWRITPQGKLQAVPEQREQLPAVPDDGGDDDDCRDDECCEMVNSIKR